MRTTQQSAPDDTRQDPDADPRRARVLECAFSLFSTLGYGQTGMSQIATDSHVSTAWIYREFGGKRELFDAVFDDKVGDFIAAINPGSEISEKAASKSEFVGLLPELATRTMSVLETDPRLFTGLLTNAASTDTEMRYRILGLEALHARQVAAAFDRALDHNWLPGDDLTSTVLGHAVLALGLPGAVMLIDGDMSQRDYLLDAGIELNRNGLLGTFSDDDVTAVMQALEDFRPPPPLIGGSDRRSQLMDAALSCYLEYGYFTVTPTIIAQAAGVAYGTFYTYFENRRVCLWEVVDRETSRILAATSLHRPIPVCRLELIARLTELVETARRFTEDNPDLASFLVLGVVGIDRTAAERMAELFLRICGLAGDYLRRCAAAGLLREGIDPDAAAQTLVAVVFAAIAAQIDIAAAAEPAQIVLPLVAMLCGGAEGVDITA
ncbi:TetR/AcrR family transcriptional regulator [Gordonia shandongensis]|uniref:TetR/AcrR family transcriptional regulator n=1 Tax=Gordonia shandongensis TaxID=376351 RepID=UPI00047D18D9|nr:TetR/AcrR family transcriptional regulator [Gordonia shandongensis]